MLLSASFSSLFFLNRENCGSKLWRRNIYQAVSWDVAPCHHVSSTRRIDGRSKGKTIGKGKFSMRKSVQLRIQDATMPSHHTYFMLCSPCIQACCCSVHIWQCSSFFRSYPTNLELSRATWRRLGIAYEGNRSHKIMWCIVPLFLVHDLIGAVHGCRIGLIRQHLWILTTTLLVSNTSPRQCFAFSMGPCLTLSLLTNKSMAKVPSNWRWLCSLSTSTRALQRRGSW